MVEGGPPANVSLQCRCGRQRGGPRQGEVKTPPRATTASRRGGQDRWDRVVRRDVGLCRARGRPARSGASLPGAWRRTGSPPPVRGWGVPVAESVLAPPGPIPNPVVTQCSAGEYCGGDPTGGEAAAGTPHLGP